MQKTFQINSELLKEVYQYRQVIAAIKTLLKNYDQMSKWDQSRADIWIKEFNERVSNCKKSIAYIDELDNKTDFAQKEKSRLNKYIEVTESIIDYCLKNKWDFEWKI